MPTIKQQNAVQETLKNIDRKQPLTKGEILDNAGYGKVVQNQPKQVFDSKGFIEELNKQLPDESLAKKHKYLLSKQRKEETQTKALDMAYKVKGHYAPDKHLNITIEDVMLTIIAKDHERRKAKKNKI